MLDWEIDCRMVVDTGGQTFLHREGDQQFLREHSVCEIVRRVSRRHDSPDFESVCHNGFKIRKESRER